MVTFKSLKSISTHTHTHRKRFVYQRYIDQDREIYGTYEWLLPAYEWWRDNDDAVSKFEELVLDWCSVSFLMPELDIIYVEAMSAQLQTVA